MELDMTQKNNAGAVLSFTIHKEMNDDLQEMRTDGKHTNIGMIVLILINRLMVGVNG